MTKEEKFNKFWALYPRKVTKLAAERSWKKLTLKKIDKIFNIYYDHLMRWKYTETKFIPHASTWLNQERWEDELEPLPNQNQSVYKDIEEKRKEFLNKLKDANKSAASDEDKKKALGLKK